MSFDANKLWNLLKSTKNKCPIYQEIMTDELASTPKTYAVFSNRIFDNPFVYGDNKSLYRKNTFTIRIHSDDIEKINETISIYVTILNNEEIDFDIYGPTPDPITGRFSIEMTGSYIYGI